MQQPVRAKKHLGQHFLNDETIARNIVDALLEKDKTTPIIEVGPGTGVLTQHLIIDTEKFFALDVDTESVAFLKTILQTFASLPSSSAFSLSSAST